MPIETLDDKIRQWLTVDGGDGKTYHKELMWGVFHIDDSETDAPFALFVHQREAAAYVTLACSDSDACQVLPCLVDVQTRLADVWPGA